MKRTIYDEDHEAFRASVKEFLDREVVPAPRGARRATRRSRATSGSRPASRVCSASRSPRSTAASGGRRLPLQRGARRGARARSTWRCLVRGHPRRHRRAVPRPPHHRGAAAALAARLLHRRAAHGDRDDRAVRRLRPRGAEDDRRPGRRRLGPQRLEDVHHQRLLRRPGRRRRAHRPGEEGAAASRCSASRPAWTGFSRGRKLDKVGQDESDTAELFFEDVRVPDDDLIGELDNGFIHMMKYLPQERLGSAITNLAHAAQILDETVQYAKERKAFGQPIGSFQHNKFLLAELVTQVEVTQAYVDQCVRRPHRRASSRRSTPRRRSGGPRRCRTRCSTTASSSTAATAT